MAMYDLTSSIEDIQVNVEETNIDIDSNQDNLFAEENALVKITFLVNEDKLGIDI